MRSDHPYEVIDADMDFSGGMNMLDGRLSPGQYRYARNIQVRGGMIETRPSVNRPSPVALPGWEDDFYFNEDNARDNDPGHTGFWFPWTFVGTAFNDIQGWGTMRFPNAAFTLQIVVSDGRVYAADPGQVRVIPTVDRIDGESVVRLVPAYDWLVMFRPGKPPLRWNGDAEGFVAFTAAGTTNRIPYGIDGVYAANRLWVVGEDGSTVFASDLLDIDAYEFVGQQFSFTYGDGDSIQRLIPFRDDTIVVFKKRSTHYLYGINGYVNIDAGITLASVVAVKMLSPNTGLVARECAVLHGENVSFLSYRGITSLRRTQENTVIGVDVPLSAPIRPLIEGINWNAAGVACAGYHDSYLLFAVPTQGSSHNNTILVYDLLAAGGNGAWISVWDGDLLTPAVFYEIDEELRFISYDGAVRVMFQNGHHDTLHPTDDVHHYRFDYGDATRTVKVDELRRWRVGGDGAMEVRRCLVEHLPAASEWAQSQYWGDALDQNALFPILSEVWTRWYDHGSPESPKRNSRAEVIIAHQNPSITIKVESPELATLDTKYSAVTYDRTAYEVDNLPAWTASNVNLDWWTNGRQDYTVFVPAAGLSLAASTGIDINAFTDHSFRFIPRPGDNLRWSARIYNTQGRMKIRRVVSKAAQGRFAMRDVA